MVSATFAHVEPMHLFFNVASAYSLGELESAVGGAAFARATLALAALTPAILLAFQHALITRHGRARHREGLGLGYSGVIFGLLVVACLRMRRYCPVPGWDALCMKTYAVEVPAPAWLTGARGAIVLGFNGAPFALLVLTSAILPVVTPAEDFSRLNTQTFTATAWIFIPAYLLCI